jgi:hypothetical protein
VRSCYSFTLLLPLALAWAAQAATVGPTDRFIPLVHDGGGWATQITVTNLSDRPALVIVAFLTVKGYSEPWDLGLRATAGKTFPSAAEASLRPGASVVIETAGKSALLTRGFAEIVEASNQPIGAFATLTQRDGETIVRSQRIPLSPGHERRSVLPLDLRDPSQEAQITWVSLTSSVFLSVTFRDLTGAVVLNDQINFDGRAQVTFNFREQWQSLKDFRGTMQWEVSFPFADRYEPRTLAGLLVQAAEGQAWTVSSGMTLPADQAKVDPY